MKKVLVILFLVFISGTSYADKYLYLTRDSKPLKLTDGDFKILCDNSICYINGSEEEKREAGKKNYDFINACLLFADNEKDNISEQSYQKECLANLWNPENELLMPDELVEIDILGAGPVKYIKNVTIFRDDTVGELVLKAIGKERITIVPDSLMTDLNKIPVFGRKADILILHRGIWELQNGTFLVGWFAMPYMVNEGNYDVPDWWK